MARYRSYLFREATVGEGFLILDGRESHHLVRVFRAREGESIEVLDGRGKRYLGTVEIANGKGARIAVDEIIETARTGPEITLLQSMPKGKTMDLILRMATEIGATSIQPIFTDQGDVQMKGDRLLSKFEKWRITMIEACKQCGLSHLPSLEVPEQLSAWLEQTPESDASLRIVASLEEGSRPLVDVLSEAKDVQSVVVAIGPEGDFTLSEYTALREHGFKSVRLGANVLRAETAAAYILSVVDQCTNSE
ncbi:MAG: RsmE family RNA methyltransferase [Opitutaceae bacterium]